MSDRLFSRNSVFDARNPAAWAAVVAILLVANLARAFAARYHYNVVDDAYISFQYAKNLASGHGLVFNVGERVEGYTNFLWVIVLTPLYALTRALTVDFSRAAISLNIVIACVDLALLFVICRRLYANSFVPIVAVLALTALDNAYQGYAMSGLENHLFILLLLTALLIWQARPRRASLWLGFVMALLTMTRPDGALFVVAFALTMGAGAVLSARFRDDETRKQWLRQAAIVIGAWLAVYGAYFLWRYSYYGALLPNTFYLKVGNTFDAVPRGVKYVNGFLVDRYYVPLAALFVLRWMRSPLVRWVFLYVVLHTAYVIYVGGDFYSGYRFLVVLLPLFYLLIGRVAHGVLGSVSGWRRWVQLTRRPLLGAACVAVLAGLAGGGLYRFTVRGLARGPYGAEIVHWSETVDNTVRYMKWLRTFAPPGSSMVVGDIGSAGFFADIRVVDTHGVVDPVIAHQKIPGFGKGKPGHEKHGSRKHLLRDDPYLIKWGWIHGDHHKLGYYLFTDFPPSLDVAGLWVKDERDRNAYLGHTRIRFSRVELRKWQKSGTAFQQLPTAGSPKGQSGIIGHQGTYVNSFTEREGDRATGRLLSPPFALHGELLQLRVGGGRDPERLRVSLLIAGKRIYSATGHNHEVLGRREWDISAYRGQSARLEIVDDATGRWGHLMVDEVVQWQAPTR